MKDTTCKGPAGATGQGGLLGGDGIGPETWWLSVVGGITSAKALGQARAWHARETEEAREHGEGTGQAGQGLVEGYGPRRGRA